MKTKFFAISMLLCTVLANVACGCVDPKPNEDKDSIDSDSVNLNADAVVKPSSATLLFDASGSMHGYLKSIGDSRFIGVISFFENMSKKTIVRLYGKEEGKTIEKEEFNQMLNNGKIEWSNESNLKAMVGSMKSHVNGGDDVCFLVTDGILSGSDSEINSSPDKSYNIKMRQKMSVDIRSMFDEKDSCLSVLIVRYNAKFNGMYSCYNNEGKNLINKERPFFVIALGKWCYVKYLEETLNEKKGADRITTPYEDIIMIGDMRSYQKMKLSPADGLNPKKGKMVIKKDFRDGSVVLSADLGSLPDYMQTDNYMNANIEMSVQHGAKSEKSLDKDYYEVSVDGANGKKKLRLTIKSSQLKDSKLTFRLKYTLPEWIETKSDDNDLDIAINPIKLGKTFNLKYFVEGFTALSEEKYIKEQSVEFK